MKKMMITGMSVLLLSTLAGCKPGVYYNPKHYSPKQQGQVQSQSQNQELQTQGKKPTQVNTQTQPKPVVGQPLINFSEPAR